MTTELEQQILSFGQAAEYRLAQQDFLYWTKFVKIHAPEETADVPMELWPHLVDFFHILESHRLIVLLKARRIGLSWLMAARDLHTALYKGNVTIPIISQGEKEAWDQIERMDFIHQHLPDPLKPPRGNDSKEELIYPTVNSVIRAMPSTKKAGRSMAGTRILFDEADHHEYFKTAYSAVKPLIDDAGGQMIVASTSNPENMQSYFKELYRKAPGNGFHPVFYPYTVRPGRDEGWWEQRKAESLDVFEFEKEYPPSAERALSHPTTLVAFPHEILDEMKKDVREPIEQNGVVSIYQRHSPGKRYASATDTSHGVGRDHSVTVILDVATGYVVADIFSNVISTRELAVVSIELLARYGNPLWAIEDNDWGHDVLERAVDLRYPRLYYEYRNDFARRSNADVPGWHTDRGNREYLVWGELMAAVHARAITIPSASGLAQFYDVIRNPRNRGKIEAPAPACDDYPLAVGIALQVRKEVPVPLHLPVGGPDGYRLGTGTGSIYKVGV